MVCRVLQDADVEFVVERLREKGLFQTSDKAGGKRKTVDSDDYEKGTAILFATNSWNESIAGFSDEHTMNLLPDTRIGSETGGARNKLGQVQERV